MKKKFVFTLLVVIPLFYDSNANAQNTRYGSGALVSPTSGNYNTAIGHNALNGNTTGSFNTATGDVALAINTTGSYNSAYGWAALGNNTTGIYNTALGVLALSRNNGSYNTATGANALYNNTFGTRNTASGYQSMNSNTNGNSNTAYGYQALYQNQSGSLNTANGYMAIYNNRTGFGNTGDGYMSLGNNSTGILNTASGFSALAANETGSNNTALGSYANVSLPGLSNTTVIGNNAIVNASNKIVIGNTSIMTIGGYVDWSVFSDGRFKENVKENVPGLNFITKLRPVTYTVDVKKLEEHLTHKMPDSVKAARMRNGKVYSGAGSRIQTGFIAQEVEKVARELGYDFDGVNAPQNPTDHYTIAYGQFVIPLVKAVQELATISEKNDRQIDSIQKQIDELRLTISANSNHSSPVSNIDLALTSASLEQNMPNPFISRTSITYTLPQKFTTAQISVSDASGKILKQVNVSGAGKGKAELDTRTLPAGTYNYALFIDGRLISTKQMVMTK